VQGLICGQLLCSHYVDNNIRIHMSSMAATSWIVYECGNEISVNIQCFTTSYDKIQRQCNVAITNEIDGDNFLEVKLDMDELCEFSNMSIRP
jgi:hypothetical protein